MGHPDISIAVMWYGFKAIEVVSYFSSPVKWISLRWQGLQGNEKEVGVKIFSSGEIMKTSNLQILRKREESPYYCLLETNWQRLIHHPNQAYLNSCVLKPKI